MSELGDRLRRHVEGSAPAIGAQEVMASRPRSNSWTRRVAVAAAVLAIAGTVVVAGSRIGGDDPPAEVGADNPIVPDGQADLWETLGHGQEAPDPIVPEGWKTLEHGRNRFSVPADWATPAGPHCPSSPGFVVIDGVEPICEPPDTLPSSAVRIGVADEFSATGPEAQQVDATVTDSGRVRVLQDGPVADTVDWQQVDYGGLAFRVPPSWPVVDLPASFRTETRDDGSTSVSGHLNPGSCGGAWFGSGEVALGVTPYAPSCPRIGEYDLRPGLGVWVREVEPSHDLRSVTTLSGTVDGLAVEVLEMDVGGIADPLHVLVTDGERRVLLSLGVGLDTVVARSILHSISASQTAEPSPSSTLATVADCDAFDRFAVPTGIVYDYDPSKSPEHLRDSAAAVIRATLVGLREESEGSTSYAVFAARVDRVEKGAFQTGEEIEFSVAFAPASVPFASIEGQFTRGLEVVLFLDAGPWPGGWGLFLEGFWAGCDEGPSKSVLVEPVIWSHEGSLDHLLERTSGPIENEIGIDAAYRADDGTIVVTVTGYRWGYARCRGAYSAAASTTDGQLTISATEYLTGDRSGECVEVGFSHVLGVTGTSDTEARELVDAATGDLLSITDGLDDVRPSFYRDRPQVPNCGFLDRSGPDDETADMSRQCFRDAYDRDDPAELAVLEFGDEGESAVRIFRVLGNGDYEVLVEQRPPVDNRGTSDGVWRWLRHECDSIYFRQPPESLIANQPVLNYDGECREVEVR
ncbi:MAG: hypothetical protein R8F63_03975 [Acidimicrobiales bacterium]|nr:hypothetical protein [Acidimicrobiales bacterium]